MLLLLNWSSSLNEKSGAFILPPIALKNPFISNLESGVLGLSASFMFLPIFGEYDLSS